VTIFLSDITLKTDICLRCGGTGKTNYYDFEGKLVEEDPCNACLGKGYREIGMVTGETVNETIEKIDTILSKCNKIWKKVKDNDDEE